MLADPTVLAWFRPGFVDVDTEFPNPFFGIGRNNRGAWPELSMAAKCAMRWRGTVRRWRGCDQLCQPID